MTNLIVEHGEPRPVIVMTAEDLKAAISDLFAVFRAKEKNADTDGDMLLSRAEAAAALQVNASTLWRWAKMGYLVPVKLGNKTVYRKADIDAMRKTGLPA